MKCENSSLWMRTLQRRTIAGSLVFGLFQVIGSCTTDVETNCSLAIIAGWPFPDKEMEIDWLDPTRVFSVDMNTCHNDDEQLMWFVRPGLQDEEWTRITSCLGISTCTIDFCKLYGPFSQIPRVTILAVVKKLKDPNDLATYQGGRQLFWDLKVRSEFLCLR
jgi:hypothetical protein